MGGNVLQQLSSAGRLFAFLLLLIPVLIGCGWYDNYPTEKPGGLSQDYPNPFCPTTTISFNIPDSAHTVLVIYNVLGEVVDTLVNRDLAAGSHEFTWDTEDTSANALCSGVYFYKLQAGDFTETKKIILLK